MCLGARGLSGLVCYLPEIRKQRVIACFLLLGLATIVGQAPSSSGGGAAPSSAKSASSPSERVVLKVGKVQVTQADFETMVSDLEALQGTADLNPKAVADSYSQLLMLSQQAVANHLDSSPEVLRQLALDRQQILSNAEFARLKSQAKPTPEQVSAYYS